MAVLLAHIDTSLLTFRYNGGVVPQANSVTCLGVVIDKGMKMTEHIHHLRVKASNSLPLLRYAAECPTEVVSQSYDSNSVQ